MYFNFDLKIDFIEYLIENNKPSSKLYNKIFNSSARTEELMSKDLYLFDKKDLMVLYKAFAKDVKITTIINYNFLIKEYKSYCYTVKNIKDTELDVLETKDIKSIKSEKDYYIINDEEFNQLVNVPTENCEMNIIIFLKLYWQTDARLKPIDILSLKISDVDTENNVVELNSIKYKVSEDLIQDIVSWSKETEVDVFNKGTYKLPTMEENNGYVLRKTKSKRSNMGEPMSLAKFDNNLYTWCTIYLDGDFITIKDLTMSLALKYMLENYKTHTEMFTEQRYFQKTLSFVYQDVFNKYAKIKYPALYKRYVEYFVGLGKKYNYYV